MKTLKSFFQKKTFKIAKMILPATFLLCAISVLSFIFLNNAVNKKIIATNINTMKELASHDERSIRNSVSLRWTCMEGIATMLEKQPVSTKEEMVAKLKSACVIVPSARYTSLLDDENHSLESSGLFIENSRLSELCEGKKERFVARGVETDVVDSTREVLVEAVPIDVELEGHHYKWLICRFPVTIFQNELKINSYNGEGVSTVIDAEGNYIVSVSRSRGLIDHDNFLTDMGEATFDSYRDIYEVRDEAKKGAVSAIFTKDGKESIMVITSFYNAEWFFVTTVPMDVFDKQTKAVRDNFVLLLFVIIFVLAVLMVLVFYQRKQKTEIKLFEAANKSKTEFLFNMSHDIRTPMNAILGYTDIGMRHVDDVKRSMDSYKKIKMAGGHLLNLINDILEMSRIESGKVELAENPIDIRQATKGIDNMSLALAIPKSIDYQTSIGKFKNPYIYADELHLNEVIINLISNAVKYTPEGGKVRYSIRQVSDVEDGKVRFRFEVTDNGIGMSEDFQQHLFEAFSREETSTVSKTEGTGLGLSIVKKILDLAGGEISVTSTPGEGSTFIVEIPFKVMEDAAVKKMRREARAHKSITGDIELEEKSVLLVEDNEMNREIATEVLTGAGLIVDTAEDGDIAVKKVTENGVEHYDFILMDIQMPVMNGYEATRAIRELPNGDRVPIIALSANAFEEDKQKSIENGMNAHVAKPIDTKALFEVMHDLMM